MDSDLISRSALLQLLYEKWLNNIPNRTCFFLDGEIQRTAEAKTIEKIMKEIEGQPTVDAVEVVHGEWVKSNPHNRFMECSVCGFYQDHTAFNYCPNCGAKMDGGKKDEM